MDISKTGAAKQFISNASPRLIWRHYFLYTFFLTRVVVTIIAFLGLYYIDINVHFSSDAEFHRFFSAAMLYIIPEILLSFAFPYFKWARPIQKCIGQLEKKGQSEAKYISEIGFATLSLPKKQVYFDLSTGICLVLIPLSIHMRSLGMDASAILHMYIAGLIAIFLDLNYAYLILTNVLRRPLEILFQNSFRFGKNIRYRKKLFSQLFYPSLVTLLALVAILGTLAYQQAIFSNSHILSSADLHDISKRIILVGVVTISLIATLSYLLSKSISSTVNAMEEAISKVGQGDFFVRVPDTRRDELGSLAHSLNRMIERLDDLTCNLESRVTERTEELRTANEQLKSLDKAKNRFFSNITHEFRTPLVSLSATLQLLREKSHDPEIEMLLKTSQLSLGDMLENVNDLLTKTRSEKGMLEMKWAQVDIGGFLEKSCKVFESLAAKQHNRFSFTNRLVADNSTEASLKIYADRPKLKKILNNLVGNAMKFTKNGDIEVVLDKTDGYCRLRVRDTGPGIPKEDIGTIFNPFTQASNNALRESQGTGLGLAMVKDFVEKHQGKVSVESEVGTGSTFTVLLPLGDAHVDKTKLDTTEVVEDNDSSTIHLGLTSFDDLDLTLFVANDPNRSTLLLVEDNPQVLQALAYVLKDHYNLRFAKDGQEGLEKTRELKPDLIISDIMMPRMNGYEFVHAVKSDPDLKMIPFILLTSKADIDSRIKGLEEGADEYLSKPFNNQEVLTRVFNLIQKRKMEIEFIHAEKLVSLGRTVAGVAHEINNPIFYAKGFIEQIGDVFALVKKGDLSLEQGMTMMEDAIRMAHDGIERVCKITKSMKTFVRPGLEGFHPNNIHEGIDSTLAIVHTNQHLKLAFHKHYDLKKDVVCNINQLNQVFMNLLQNAIDAFDGRTQGDVWIDTSEDGENACIVIRDNGPGIPESIQARLFDPFFTTKDVGKGTGLGLYLCRQIVQEHGGVLIMESKMGEGTSFTIKLPLAGVKNNADEKRFTHLSVDQQLTKVTYPVRM